MFASPGLSTFATQVVHTMDVLIRSGLLVTCEAPIKRLVVFLNRNGQFGKIVEIDETHLLIEKDFESKMKVEVDKVLEENVFKFDEMEKF